MPQPLYLYRVLNRTMCYIKRRSKGNPYNLRETPQRQHAWSKKAFFRATLYALLLILSTVCSLDNFFKKPRKKKSKKQTPKAVLPSSQDLKAKSFKNIPKPPSGLLRRVRTVWNVGSPGVRDRNSTKQRTAVRKRTADGIRIHMIW